MNTKDIDILSLDAQIADERSDQRIVDATHKVRAAFDAYNKALSAWKPKFVDSMASVLTHLRATQAAVDDAVVKLTETIDDALDWDVKDKPAFVPTHVITHEIGRFSEASRTEVHLVMLVEDCEGFGPAYKEVEWDDEVGTDYEHTRNGWTCQGSAFNGHVARIDR